MRTDLASKFVRVTHEGGWSVALWNRGVLARFQYGDYPGLSSYD